MFDLWQFSLSAAGGDRSQSCGPTLTLVFSHLTSYMERENHIKGIFHPTINILPSFTHTLCCCKPTIFSVTANRNFQKNCMLLLEYPNNNTSKMDTFSCKMYSNDLVVLFAALKITFYSVAQIMLWTMIFQFWGKYSFKPGTRSCSPDVPSVD